MNHFLVPTQFVYQCLIFQIAIFPRITVPSLPTNDHDRRERSVGLDLFVIFGAFALKVFSQEGKCISQERISWNL